LRPLESATFAARETRTTSGQTSGFRKPLPSAITAFQRPVEQSESVVTFQKQEMKPNQQASYDHTFRAIRDHEVPWQEGSKSVLKLPVGVQVKIFAHDMAMGRIDMRVKFPPGYVEPEHYHKSWHSIVVLKGRMCVAGKDLRPGDYVFGWDELHGPYEYPDGCEVFVVFMGESVVHEWDEAKHKMHQNIWKAESEEGRQGVDRHTAQRKIS